jgi:hypothetical protein
MPKETPAPSQSPLLSPAKAGNGTSLFHVLDPEGYEIVLEVERWDHIIEGHPEIKPLLDLIKATAETPEFFPPAIRFTVCSKISASSRRLNL